MRTYFQTKSGKTFRVEQHGMCNTITYRTWRCMRSRCHDKTHKQYKDYGGRGILVCDEWYTSFTTFLNDMGERPSKEHSIERINNDKGYSKDNCKWVHRSEQYSNKRKPPSKVLMTINGETKSITEWGKIKGIPVTTLWRRQKKMGWTDEECVLTPVAEKKPILCMYNGELKPLFEICKLENLEYHVMQGRIKMGWTFEEAKNKPVIKRKTH